MKILVKISLKIIMLLLIAFLLLYSLSEYFRPNKLIKPSDMTTKVDGFYNLEKNSMDILLFGTSHIFYGVNPGVISRDTDLNSYIFAGECQPIEITLQFVKEALKTQNPQLIILDIFGLTKSIETCRTDGSAKVNTEDMKLNENKIAAVKTYDEKLFGNIFDITRYHNRIFSMNTKDFKNTMSKIYDSNFGFALAYPYEQYQSDYVYYNEGQQDKPEQSKIEVLSEIIELCQINEVELLLIKTPYYATEGDISVYNYIENLIHEKEVKFLNINEHLEEIEYRFNYDGSAWHANAIGSFKVTTFLTDYLRKNYDLEFTNNYYDQEYNNLFIKTEVAIISKTKELEEWLKVCELLDVTMIMNYQGTHDFWLPQVQADLLSNIGLDLSQLKMDQNAVLNNSSNKKNVTSMENLELVINEHKYAVNCEGELFIDDRLVNKAETNLTLYIVDNSSGYLVDTISVITAGEAYIYRK